MMTQDTWRKKMVRKLLISCLLSLLLAIIIPPISFYIAGHSLLWKQWGFGILIFTPTIFAILLIILLPVSLFSDWITEYTSTRKNIRRMFSFFIHLLFVVAITFYVQWHQYYQTNLLLNAPSILQLIGYSFFNLPAFCAVLYWLLDEWWKRDLS